MADGKNKRHIFYSSGTARAFSVINGVEAQGVLDLIKEMSLSVGVNILTEEESLISLLKAGASIDDLVQMKILQTFLKITGETSKVHKLVAEDISEKKVEKFSEITLHYYKLISEIGKSEAEDFSEFMNLFPLKYDLSSDYASHLPDYLKPYDKLFRSHDKDSKRGARIVKKRFPEFFKYRDLQYVGILKFIHEDVAVLLCNLFPLCLHYLKRVK